MSKKIKLLMVAITAGIILIACIFTFNKKAGEEPEYVEFASMDVMETQAPEEEEEKPKETAEEATPTPEAVYEEPEETSAPTEAVESTWTNDEASIGLSMNGEALSFPITREAAASLPFEKMEGAANEDLFKGDDCHLALLYGDDGSCASMSIMLTGPAADISGITTNSSRESVLDAMEDLGAVLLEEDAYLSTMELNGKNILIGWNNDSVSMIEITDPAITISSDGTEGEAIPEETYEDVPEDEKDTFFGVEVVD